MAIHVILGKGAVGSTTARRLAEQGQEVRVLSRSGAPDGPSIDGIEHLALDATDARALTDAARGAAVLYNCANPAYHRWATDWPPVADALLAAAEATGAVLVTMSNLYGYGPVDGPLTEDLPLAAVGTNGQVRARMWRDALAAHEAGRIRATEARASDFFGPGVTDTGMLGERTAPRVLKGKSVRVLGSADVPHSFTFMPDVAETLVCLGRDERAWGRAWHVPTAPARTQHEMVDLMADVAGVPRVKVGTVPAWAVRAAGAVSPMMRELQETRYQFEQPFVLDSSAATEAFGLTATPPADAMATTMAWWRERLDGGGDPVARAA